MKRTTAENSVAGLYVDKNAGTGTLGTKRIAEDANNLQEEVCHVIERAGRVLTGADRYQLAKSVVGLSHGVGELVFSEFEDAPGDYWPAVDRSSDQDLTAAHWPLLHAKLYAKKAKVNGVTDHTVSVSGSNITFPGTLAANALLKLFVADAQVSGWLNGGQAATIVEDWSTASTRRTINIAGTDYAVTGVNLATRVMTVSGTPASGSQAAIAYTYRIGGSSSVRLHKIAGFVGVVAGDVDGEIVEGWRKMDRGQLHGHYVRGATGSGSALNIVGASVTAAQGTVNFPFNQALDYIANGGGTPRTGKTTDPRTIGQHAYTWGGIYLA